MKNKIKLGKQKKVTIKGFNGTFGTGNSRMCYNAYFELCTYCMPADGTDYTKKIDRFKHRLEKHMYPIIGKAFEGNINYAICVVDERITSVDKLGTRLSVLPIEFAMVFNNKIVWRENLKKIEELMNIFVEYLLSYEEIIFSVKVSP